MQCSTSAPWQQLHQLQSMKFSISLLYVVLKFLLFSVSTVMSVDSISRMESIKDGELLVSKGGRFVLGFFSPGTSTSRYLGIWYKNVPVETIVWVANRDDPIKNNSGVLLLNNEGNLVLYVENQNNIIWSTNAKASSKNVTAHILDTGNLELVQGDIYGKKMKVVVWQSFDHPTNTLLPHMKLGLNRSTGLNRFLTSWKSKNDPGIGNISLRIDPDGYPQLFFYKNMHPKWRLGSWNGYRWTGAPHTNMLNSTFVNNQDEISVTWDNFSGSPLGRLIVYELGSVIEYSWSYGEKSWIEQYTSPREPCDYYQHCGPYGKCVTPVHGEFECTCLPGYQPKSLTKWNMRDASSGCVRKNNKSMCRAGEGFVRVASVKIPDTSVALADMSLRSTSECEEKCSKNCSCTAYAIADLRNQVGCITWHGGLKDTREYYMDTGQDFYIRVDAIEFAQYRKSRGLSSAKKLILILCAGVISLIAFVLMFFWIKKKKRGLDEQAIFQSDATSISSSFNLSARGMKRDERETNADVALFDLKTIITATDNFSPANKLGQGGFGSVYKGQLANGTEIAVKRLLKISGQGIGEFKNEVVLTVKLQHKNLVRLLGCCINKDEKMLIYEYLPNKSLDFFLFDKTKSAMLDWTKRFEIIFGIARGVLYLHEDSRLKIIHRDLKASNVLLDATMNPKIADFGMARLFGDDQRNANTNRVVGTYGYMSPEYAMEGQYSVKSDVFSFGVLLLEIISGRRNSNYYDESLSLNLIGHVWQLWREEKPLDVVDSSLGMSYPSTEVMRCIQIGLLCVQESADDRPSMLEIVFMLGNEASLPSPSKPAFIFKKRCSVSESSASVKGGSSTSTNELTVTTLEPR